MNPAPTALPSTIDLEESFRADPSLSRRVDLSAGVLRGVKIVGLHSANTGRTLGLDPERYGPAVDQPYEYAREALAAAAPLYEGAAVFVDHLESSYSPTGARRVAQRERKTAERFGRLVNVRCEASGLHGDLEYLKSHPLAGMVVEAALRMPESLALSHNVAARPGLRDGRLVIESITAVRSVDLVGERPAATRGLFESAAQPSGAQPTAPANVDPDKSQVLLECVALLNEAGLPVRPPVLEALAGLPDTAARRELIAALPALSSTGSWPAPRSRSPSVEPSAAKTAQETPGEFIRALRGGW